MSRKQAYRFLVVVWGFCAFNISLAEKTQSTKTEMESKPDPATFVSTEPKQNLPLAGKNKVPEKRITVGAPRGANSSQKLSIYIPEDHVIQRANLILKWEISQPTQMPVIIRLIAHEQTEPVIERKITGASTAGLHAIDLRSHAKALRPGEEYEWSVLVCGDIQCTASISTIARVALTIDNNRSESI